MPDYEEYKETATNSFRIAVELFNRPFENGRTEGVLILLDHSFEMLLKAAILRRGGEIRSDGGSGQTISLEKCVKRCRDGTRDNQRIKCLSKSEAAAILSLNNLRDYAQHEQVDVREQQLYLQSRQCTDIFEKILTQVFNESLSQYLPERVLPLSTTVPTDIASIIDQEIDEIQELMDEGAIDEARNKLKALDSVERGLADEGKTPDLSELSTTLEAVDDDKGLDDIFPSTFAALGDGVDSGGGVRINLGSDDPGLPAEYVPEEEIDEDDDVYLYTEKNIHGRYPFNPMQFKKQVNSELSEECDWKGDLSLVRLKAILKEMGLREREEFHQSELPLGAGDTRPGYSPKCVDSVVEAIETGTIVVEDAWEANKAEFGY
ncbi:hypothetical protein EGH24_06265 [Halonotius terrestris]|uniref:DUF3644 domain-containing protein n=1 Tax=Halonotius terrestris TaxID=2487750 RepID=A0A8J8PD63_9EURY|nr:DUF3644 domain-containing protein [Halonotius terrestris]TQQ83032.1 hypothetical protein EGH24_06265 [Halonotius terrestris]